MSQAREKYVYFQVGLLKDSVALDALRQDALRYHMVDQLGQLIALRLTEYYECIARSNLPSGRDISLAASPTVNGKGGGKKEMTTAPAAGSNGTHALTGQVDMSEREEKQIVTVSADVEQNADEAADFWTRF